MADLQPAPAETPETSLRKGRIGVIGIVFFVVAAAAPLVGMTGAVPVATVLGNGAGVPGAYLVVAFILLLFSVGYSAMSQHVTNAGAFFAYVGRGLGSSPVSVRRSSPSLPTLRSNSPSSASSAR